MSEHEGANYWDAEYRVLADQIADTYRFHADPSLRVPTGWESIDPYLYGGPAPGEVVYLLGRSHTGKSMFLLNILNNHPEIPMVLFTLEMPYHQAITRMTAMAMNQSDDIVMRNLQGGSLDPAASPLHTHLHWVVDTAGMSLEDMGLVVERLRHDYAEDLWPRAVLIDYLELIRSRSRAQGYERTETLARDLKAWSKRYELPVFVAHQSNMILKRWEPPDEGAARGAGYTEADAVIGIWHPASNPAVHSSRDAQRIYKARLIKNRIGGHLSDELDFQLDNSLQLWDPVRTERLRLDVF